MGLFTKYNDRFVDMHIHILPGIDDGAHDMDTSLEMLRIAAKNGVTDMIVTPHFKSGRHNARVETIENLIEQLSEEMQKEDFYINLYPGNELFYYDESYTDIDSGRILTLNGTDRVLVEFHPGERYIYIRNAIENLLDAGYVPIIAHVERYECFLGNVGSLREIRAIGAEIQINAASVEGRLGLKVKKFIAAILKEQLVDYVGTDAHNTDQRSPKISKCMSLLHKMCDEEYVRSITCDNALSIINA